MKKHYLPFLASSLAFGLLVSGPSPSFANAEEGKVLDLNNLAELEASGEVTIKELSYDEAIEKIAATENISSEEAEVVYANATNAPSKLTRGTMGVQAVAASTTLHEIKLRQQVTSTYRPAVQIFAYMSGSGSFWQFDKLYDVDLDRKDITYSTSKQFQGKLRAEILSLTQIFYLINGDFYDNGTTTITGSVTASGVVWSGTGTISNSSSHFKYWNNSGYYNSY
ncbi:hypothetical protein [Peribacillus loiseleuriae]|uniref:hypothetical protein n=1 Tax=Peribacillus loiseleuriae TaxID=1679170 RepID=UPI003D03190B